MRRHTAIALLGVFGIAFGFVATDAEAKRVYYEVGGHKYWYNSNTRHAKRAEKKAAAEAAKAPHEQPAGLPNFATLFGLQPTPAPAPAPVTQSTAVPPSGPDVTVPGRSSSRVNSRAERRRERLAARIANRERRRALRLAEARLERRAETRLEQNNRMIETAAAPISRREAETTGSIRAAPSFMVLPPPPPGPPLVQTVTYDFAKGVKTTSLRDGASFVETFDPHAFFHTAVTEPAGSAAPAASAAQGSPGTIVVTPSQSPQDKP